MMVSMSASTGTDAAKNMIAPFAGSQKTRVLCVDDHRDIRSVLSMIIDAEEDMECVGCLGSADTLIDEVGRVRPDVILLDATMPGKDPFAAITELASTVAQPRTILFTAWEEREIIDHAIAAGAQGWISKTADPEAIIRAVRQVAAGGLFFPENDKSLNS
jgi:DNA-binding NarL/FixJ family response regulator